MMKKIVNIAIMLILVCNGIQASAIKKIFPLKKDVVFEVIFDDATKEKPFLIVFEKGINQKDVTKAGQKIATSKSGQTNSFIFEIKDQVKPLYFSINLKGVVSDLSVLKEFLFEPGDHIMIHIKKTQLPDLFNYEFSGIGAAKYNCKAQFRTIGKTIADEASTVNDQKGRDFNLHSNQKYIQLAHEILDQYKSDMSRYAYDLLYADVIGWQGQETMNLLSGELTILLLKKDTVACKKLGVQFFKDFNFDYANRLPDSVLCDSKDYSRFILAKVQCITLAYHPHHVFLAMYKEIKKTNNRAFRDKLIMGFMMKYLVFMNDHYDEIYSDAIRVVKDPYCLKRVKEIGRNNVGNKAYNFNLTDRNGKIVRLSDFKGKNVFIDFWFTGCIHCQHYFEQVVDSVETIYKNNPDIVFITVSIDRNKDKWIQSLNEGKYTSDHAINLYTNGEGDQNGIIQYYNIISYPRPMLIDREGKIVKLVGSELRRKEKFIAELEKMTH